MRLTSSETTDKMAVSEHASGLATIHGLLHSVRVGLLTLRRQFLLAEEAVTASNLERSDVTLANFDTSHSGANLVNDTAELVTENVAG